MTKLNLISLATLIVLGFHAKAQENRAKLSIDDVEAKINISGQPQIIDARSAEEFAQIHLKNAIVLSTDPTKAASQINALNKQKPVFVYAIGNYRSGILAKQLRAQGFNKVYEIPGGIANWVGSGKPVETLVKKGFTLADFQNIVGNEKLILVDFGSKYCPGCIKMAPLVDSASNETGTPLYKVEVFDNTALAHQLKINAIPNIALYKNGVLVWHKEGLFPKNEILTAIKQELPLSAKSK
ncbi:MAG: sulfurtransferase [Mucilaginibacter sp.]|nr:sulfurtransferase [Mucilaginibacter sp.]